MFTMFINCRRSLQTWANPRMNVWQKKWKAFGISEVGENSHYFTLLTFMQFQLFALLVTLTHVSNIHNFITSLNCTYVPLNTIWIPFDRKAPSQNMLKRHLHMYKLEVALAEHWFSALQDTLIYTGTIYKTVLDYNRKCLWRR